MITYESVRSLAQLVVAGLSPIAGLAFALIALDALLLLLVLLVKAGRRDRSADL